MSTHLTERNTSISIRSGPDRFCILRPFKLTTCSHSFETAPSIAIDRPKIIALS